MADDLIAFVERMDRCWLDRRFDDLALYLAPDVVFVAPGGAQRAQGIAQAIDSYRGFMERSALRRFETSDHVVTRTGPVAVVEYAWTMEWIDEASEHAATGSELLVLGELELGWRVVWRMPLAT